MACRSSNQSQRIEGWERDEDFYHPIKNNIFLIFCNKKENCGSVVHQQANSKKSKINLKLPHTNKIALNRPVTVRVKPNSLKKQLDSKQINEGARSSRPPEQIKEYLKNNTTLLRYNDHSKYDNDHFEKWRKKQKNRSIRNEKKNEKINDENSTSKQFKQFKRSDGKDQTEVKDYEKSKYKYLWKALFQVKKQQLVFSSYKSLKKKNSNQGRRKGLELQEKLRKVYTKKYIPEVQVFLKQRSQMIEQQINQIKIGNSVNYDQKHQHLSEKGLQILKREKSHIKKVKRSKMLTKDQSNIIYKQADLFTDAHLIQISENISNIKICID